MNSRHPFGWDLPPGCSQRDIDNAMGGDNDCIDCPECNGTGKVFDDGAPDAVPIVCSKCGGEGIREMTGEEIEKAKQDARELAADMAYDRQKDKEMGL